MIVAKYVAAFLFAFFLLYLLVDVARICGERRRKRQAERLALLALEKGAVHKHNMRKITPWANQCKECKTIECAPNAPDGLEEYLKLMATAKDRKETMLHAEEYKFHDPRMQGWSCPSCKMVIPSIHDLPRSPFVNGKEQPECPYCAVKLVPPILRLMEPLGHNQMTDHIDVVDLGK